MRYSWAGKSCPFVELPPRQDVNFTAWTHKLCQAEAFLEEVSKWKLRVFDCGWVVVFPQWTPAWARRTPWMSEAATVTWPWRTCQPLSRPSSGPSGEIQIITSTVQHTQDWPKFVDFSFLYRWLFIVFFLVNVYFVGLFALFMAGEELYFSCYPPLYSCNFSAKL